MVKWWCAYWRSCGPWIVCQKAKTKNDCKRKFILEINESIITYESKKKLLNEIITSWLIKVVDAASMYEKVISGLPPWIYKI